MRGRIAIKGSHDHVCLVCSAKFTGYRLLGKKAYCSRACFYISQKRDQPQCCTNCSKLFYRKRRYDSTGKRQSYKSYCDRACYFTYKQQHMKLQSCTHCKTLFSRHAQGVKRMSRGHRIYCSVECYHNFVRMKSAHDAVRKALRATSEEHAPNYIRTPYMGSELHDYATPGMLHYEPDNEYGEDLLAVYRTYKASHE